MPLKQRIISTYLFVALLFGTYGWLFGESKYRGFFYNLGKGVVWPVTMFPALGSILSAIFILAFVVGVLVFGKGGRN